MTAHCPAQDPLPIATDAHGIPLAGTRSPDGRRPSPARRAALGAFYAANAHLVEQSVRQLVISDNPTVVEDACAVAWLQLVSRDDVTLDRRGMRWLMCVAIREAWRLASPREIPSGAFSAYSSDTGEMADPPGPLADPIERVIAGETHAGRIRRFKALPERERRDLLLVAAGYHYREIMHITGSTYSAVNHHLVNGRARLRGESCKRGRQGAR